MHTKTRIKALNPNNITPAIKAGIREIITSSIILLVVIPL
jgi:hypothetical protein